MDHCEASNYAQGLLLGLHISGLLFAMTKICTWCRDPLSGDLHLKIHALELENDSLRSEIVTLTDEKDILIMQNARSQETIRLLTTLDNEESEDETE